MKLLTGVFGLLLVSGGELTAYFLGVKQFKSRVVCPVQRLAHCGKCYAFRLSVLGTVMWREEVS